MEGGILRHGAPSSLAPAVLLSETVIIFKALLSLAHFLGWYIDSFRSHV